MEVPARVSATRLQPARACGPFCNWFSQDYSIPEEMTLAEIRKTTTAFASATKRAADAGFKVIELDRKSVV